MAFRSPSALSEHFGDRTAFVTGAGSGIGRALGAALAAAGARVVLTDIDGDALDEAVTVVSEVARHRIRSRLLDVRDGPSFRAAVEEVGDLDLLFNNAGITDGGPTHEMDADRWQRVVEVNLNGVINGTLAAYPAMVERGSGHIVNTASGAGLVAPPFVAAYAATKHAVVGLSTSLRAEALLHGVKVSVICPGAVETPILDSVPEVDPDSRPPPSRPVTPREFLDALGQRPMPADRFADAALRRVAEGRGIIVVPRSATPMWWLHRLSPALAGAAMGLAARRVDRIVLGGGQSTRAASSRRKATTWSGPSRR